MRAIAPFLMISILASSCCLIKRKQPPAIPDMVVESIDYEPCDVDDQTEPFICFVYFNENLKDLLETQAILFKQITISTLQHCTAEEIDCQITALYQNASDIGKTMSPYYDKRTGNRIGELFRQHIDLSLDYLSAIANFTPYTAERIAQQQDINGNLLIQFLNIINPHFSYEAERWLFEEFIQVQNQMVKAYQRGDYQEGEALSCRYSKLAIEFASQISLGLERKYQCECANQPSFYDQSPGIIGIIDPRMDSFEGWDSEESF